MHVTHTQKQNKQNLTIWKEDLGSKGRQMDLPYGTPAVSLGERMAFPIMDYTWVNGNKSLLCLQVQS